MFWHFFGDTVVAAVGKVSGTSRGASLPQRIATHTPYPPALLFSWYMVRTWYIPPATWYSLGPIPTPPTLLLYSSPSPGTWWQPPTLLLYSSPSPGTWYIEV